MTYSKNAWLLSERMGVVFCPLLRLYLKTGWGTHGYVDMSPPSKYLIPLEYAE